MRILFNRLSRYIKPDTVKITRSSPAAAAFRANKLAQTVGVMGLVISGANLYDSLKERDYKTASLDTVTLFTGTAETIKTLAPCIVSNSRILSNLVKYNELVTIASGAFEVAHEKPGFKLQRLGAVLMTSAAGLGGGALINSMNISMAEATNFSSALIAVAPFMAVFAGTAAVALTVEAAISENKARDTFNRTVCTKEEIAIDRDPSKQFESTGCPALQKYKNLLKFAYQYAIDTSKNSENIEAVLKRVERCAYSEQPYTLEYIEKRLFRKIEQFDQIIAQNTPWYGTSGAMDVLMGKNPKTKHRCAAQLARAQYIAAAKELKAYRSEIAAYKNPPPLAHNSIEKKPATDLKEFLNMRIEIRPHPEFGHWASLQTQPMFSPI